MQGVAGTGRWSPDGRYIVFESLVKDFYEVYVVEAAGGIPRLVSTFPQANNGAPNWSRDSQSIYFYSSHESGPYQLWKVPFNGGPPVRVTTKGGVYAVESADQRFLYYTKFEKTGIWKMPLGGGVETRVLDQPSDPENRPNKVHWCFWALAPGGIYFLNPNVPPNSRIEFFDFATRQSTPARQAYFSIWWSGPFTGWQIPALRPERTRRILCDAGEKLSLAQRLDILGNKQFGYRIKRRRRKWVGLWPRRRGPSANCKTGYFPSIGRVLWNNSRECSKNILDSGNVLLKTTT